MFVPRNHLVLSCRCLRRPLELITLNARRLVRCISTRMAAHYCEHCKVVILFECACHFFSISPIDVHNSFSASYDRKRLDLRAGNERPIISTNLCLFHHAAGRSRHGQTTMPPSGKTEGNHRNFDCRNEQSPERHAHQALRPAEPNSVDGLPRPKVPQY